MSEWKPYLSNEGDQAGSEFVAGTGRKAPGESVDKGEVFERAIAMKPLLEGVAHVLGSRYKLKQPERARCGAQ